MENNSKVLISINFVKCKVDFIELSLPLNSSIKMVWKNKVFVSQNPVLDNQCLNLLFLVNQKWGFGYENGFFCHNKVCNPKFSLLGYKKSSLVLVLYNLL
jgi:hypothetical protein